MATKKLKLEVELETAKAKRQAHELEQSGSGPSPSSGGSPSTSLPATAATTARQVRELGDTIDRAGKKVRDLGDTSKASSSQIAGVVRSFAGIGVGMAVGFAAKNMQQGAARTAVEATGGAIQGASVVSGAAMAMPIPPQLKLALSALGAAMGAGKVLLDGKAEKDQFTKDFRKGEDAYEENRLFAHKLRTLSEVDPADVGLTKKEANADQLRKVEERIAAVRNEAVALYEKQNRIIKEVNKLAEAGKIDKAKEKEAELATVRQRKEAMEALERSYDKQRKGLEREARQIALEDANATTARGSIAGADALARLGAGAAESAASASGLGFSRSTRGAAFNFGFSVPQVERKFATMTFGTPSGDKVDQAIKAATERSARLDETIEKVLEKIEQNTRGGESWQ